MPTYTFDEYPGVEADAPTPEAAHAALQQHLASKGGSQAEQWRAGGVPPEVSMETGMQPAPVQVAPNAEQITSPGQIPGALARHNPALYPMAGAAAAGAVPVAGPFLAPLGAAGAESLRQYLAGEPQSGGKTAVQGALAAAPLAAGTGLKYLGRAVANLWPGVGIGMQKFGMGLLGKTLDAIPGPSAEPQFQQLAGSQALTRMVGGQPETVPLTATLPQAAKVADDLKPVIAAWKLSPDPTLQQSADALVKLGAGGTTALPVDQFHKLMRTLGPRVWRGEGEATGAVRSLYDTLSQDLDAAAQAGGGEAKLLQEAMATHKRYVAVSDLQQKVENAKSFTEGNERFDADALLKQLEHPATKAAQRSASRLESSLTPEEMQSVSDILREVAAYPKPAAGGGFEARILPMLGLGAAAGAVGGHMAGPGSTGLIYGGAAGGLASAYALSMAMKDFAKTPLGMATLRRLILNKLGEGRGTQLMQSLAPALGGQLNSSQPSPLEQVAPDLSRKLQGQP